jgi:hypothetical protein
MQRIPEFCKGQLIHIKWVEPNRYFGVLHECIGVISHVDDERLFIDVDQCSDECMSMYLIVWGQEGLVIQEWNIIAEGNYKMFQGFIEQTENSVRIFDDQGKEVITYE